jgi:hypothetical protein
MNPIIMKRKLNFKNDLFLESRVCTRCNGTGYLPQFKHIEGGVCFKCRGAGKL